ncbi:hypothetical protein ACKKBF_B11340 [Auxenochlorella protothecoides x Auxenochlorella symbiontica]
MYGFDVEGGPVKVPVSQNEPTSWWRWLRRDPAYSALGAEEATSATGGAWCPEQGAGLVSRLLFTWVDPLLAKGLHKSLDAEDLWGTMPEDAAGEVAAAFQWHLASTASSSAQPHGRVHAALWRCYRGRLLWSGVVKLLHDCVMLASPVLLQRLLVHVQQRGSPWIGLLLALGLAGTSLLQTLLVNVYFHSLYRLCAHLKCSLVDMLYRKSLRISCGARSELGAGVVNNLQSNDAAKLWQLPQYLHMVWSGPFQILCVMGLLMRVIGVVSAVTGLAVTVALIPLLTLLGKKLASIRKESMTLTDARVKLCTEVLTGIKAIKLYAWEEPYRLLITDLRQQELAQILWSGLLNTVNSLVFQGAPIIITIVAFMTYTLLGHTLSADVAFPAIALFNLLRFPIIMFPRQITDLINCGVALRRIQTFMEAGEVAQAGPDAPLDAGPPEATPVVQASHASFSWDAKCEPLLHDICLEVNKGQLAIVVGPVGSGKSSLLAALLNEMVRLQGTSSVRGRVAYTAQEPWIQNASLEKNVTLGGARTAAYDAAVAACALGQDVAALPAGDATEIGEKGVNLSGGQRHRVALARACFADADVYLLDDPLSAVDAHVGRHLLSSCICGLLAGKTRVLVTHQLQYLPAADVVIVLQDGRITHTGPYAALLAAGVDFHQFERQARAAEAAGSAGVGPPLPEPRHAADFDQSTVPGEGEPGLVDVVMEDPAPQGAAAVAEAACVVVSAGQVRPAAAQPAEGLPAPKPGLAVTGRNAAQAGSRTTDVEQRAVGRVDRGLYLRYFAAWGAWWWLPLAMLGLSVTDKGMQAAQSWWLSLWSVDIVAPHSAHTANYYLVVYAALGSASLLVQLASGLCLVWGAIRAARTLQDDLLTRVLRLPMSFFDSQPTGRLLNRFTRDTEAVDVQLPDSVRSFTSCAVSVLWCLVLVVAVSPAIMAMLVPLALAYLWVQARFIATSREIKRLDSVAMSPIYSHFLETLSGLVTVRAFRQQDAFARSNCVMLDASNRAWWPSQVVNRWLSVRLELLGTSVVFGAALFAAVLQPHSAGLAGLAITSALQATGLMSWAVRQTTEMEISMNSVERLLEYASFETEAPAVIEGRRPLPGWPTQGALAVEGLSVRYRPSLPPVLHDVSFSLPAGSKLGIAGRTGCGKSTLMLAMYRLVEPCAGRIVLDGIDVASIGLFDLRSRLALVPQDPVIFTGTIRSNLDPFGTAGADDQRLWDALAQSGLERAVRGMPAGLDSGVSEGGGSLSQGQRQLLALARALLRHTRVLVLDEATSNVDTATDSMVQGTIARAFASCTVLTIAHRLHTIMRSDAILVLDAGRVAEFGTPGDLMRQPGSAFRGLVTETEQGGKVGA